MLVTLNLAPSERPRGQAFEPCGYLHTDISTLRRAGLRFEDGADEVGIFEMAVGAIDGKPFVIQHYIDPAQPAFSVYIHADLIKAELKQESLDAVLDALSLDDSVWSEDPDAPRPIGAKVVLDASMYDTIATVKVEAPKAGGYASILGGLRYVQGVDVITRATRSASTPPFPRRSKKTEKS